MAHERLLAPGTIGSLSLRNRIVLPAMDQNSCTDDGLVTDLTVAHYEARARGGVGLLIVETSAVAYPRGATSEHQPSLSHDGVIPGLRRLADAVHTHGAKIVVQICHHGKTAGLDTRQDRPRWVPTVPLPATDPMGMVSGTTIDELMKMATMTGGKSGSLRQASADDLAWLVDQFAEAAARVQEAGLDGVEIHAAHGYIISTFLSPAFNKRADEYGGSHEGRAKLMCRVVGAVKGRCGTDFPVIVRLDGREYGLPDGITPADAAVYARLAVDAGADAIHVSSTSSSGTGVGFTDGPLPWKPNQYVEAAQTVKAAVRVPVIAVGRISPDEGERLLQEGRTCDFVSMGRQLLADPTIPNRLAEGRPDLIRTCINCFVCVAQNFWDGKPVCAVNAELGHYDEPALAPTLVAKHVVVIGGGPGGMEAARVLASRGHRVTLLERAKTLGGTARFSSLTTPMNAELVRYLAASVRQLGILVHLETTADVASIRALLPDAVVVATGAKRSRPPVPGAELNHVMSGDDLRALLTGDEGRQGNKLPMHQRIAVAAGRKLGFTDDLNKVRELSKRWMPVGDTVVLLGGGLVGIELAEFLAERGRSVTVLEEGKYLGAEMAHPRRWRALHEARVHGVVFETEAELVKITAKNVVYRVNGEDRTCAADNVIIASGVSADTTLADSLRAEGIDVHVVGDAGDVGYIQGAIRSGYLVGRSL